MKQRPNPSSVITVSQACFLLDLLSLLGILSIKAHREHCHDHHNFHHLTDKTQMTTMQLLVLCNRFLEFPSDSPIFRPVLSKEKDLFVLKDLRSTHPLVQLVSWCKSLSCIGVSSTLRFLKFPTSYFSNQCSQDFWFTLSVSYYSDA